MESARSSAVTALAAGVAAVAGSFAVVGFTPAFLPAALASAVARLSPGFLLTFAITVLGDLGKLLNVAVGLSLAAGLFAALALFGIAVGRSLDSTVAPPAVTAAAVFGTTTLLTGAPLPALTGGLAAAGVMVAVPLLGSGLLAEASISPRRRRVLGAVGSALTVSGVGYVLGAGRGGDATSEPVNDPEVRSLLDEARDKSLSIDGLEPLVSERFFTVDINAAAPTVDKEEWTLSVTGDVNAQFEVEYDELTAMESQEVFSTLRCVGESLNGKKMDTAVWTAVPLTDIIERAGVADNCCVMLRAADGYYEEFPIEALRDGMLAYRMNGRSLPRGHGHPVRALIPGHWGEINVKWVTEMEILEEEVDGYWEEKGWHGTGPVNTVAKLHAVERDGDQITVGGHTYAGTRGISAVEVSTDSGGTWSEATLSKQLPGDDVWRQWGYEYESPGETHEVVVRAREADGTLQPQERSNAYSNGPTGWVSKEIEG